MAIAMPPYCLFGSTTFPVVTEPDIAWTGSWRASYAGSPWVGDGNGAGNDLTEETNPPATFTVGSYDAADFDGSVSELRADGTAATYFDADAISGYVFFYADALGSNLPQVYNNECLMCTITSAYVSLGVKSTGDLGFYIFSGSDKAVWVSGVTAETWHFAHFKANGSEINVGLDGVWSTPVSAGNVSSLANQIRIGGNYNHAQAFNGKILEARFINAEIDDTVLGTTMQAAVRARYGL